MHDGSAKNPWDDPETVVHYERWAHPEATKLAEIALAMTGIAAPSRLIDVGAGVGALAMVAAAKGLSVHATDNSQAMVDRLSQRLVSFADCTAEVMDFGHLALPDDGFDAAFGVLSVSMSPQGPRAVAEMVRVVRPAGVVCIVDWATVSGSPFFPILQRALDRLDGVAVPDFSWVGSATAAETGAFLEAGGCEAVFARTIEAVSVLPPPDRMLDEMTPMLAGVPLLRELTDDQRTELRALVEAEALAVIGPGTPRLIGQVAIGFVPK